MTGKKGYLLLVWGVFSCGGFPAFGQSVANYAVQVSAAVQANPAQITLSWPGDVAATKVMDIIKKYE